MSDLAEVRKELGLVHIYTGDGKGKSTAAFGLAFRAAGRDLNVLIIQFMKPADGFGEQVACTRFPNIEIHSLGLDHFVSMKPKAEDIEAAKSTLKLASDLMATGRYDVAILDEALNAVRMNLYSDKDLIDALKARPGHIEVVLTGRGTTPALEEYADYITEMKPHKHPYDRGVDARVGIEF